MKLVSVAMFLTALFLVACSRAAPPQASASPSEKPAQTSGQKKGQGAVSRGASDFQIKAAYVHGSPVVTQAGADPTTLSLGQKLQPGAALTTPKGADAELYVQSSDFSDGVIRVSEKSWTVVEKDPRPGRPEIRVFIYGGRLGFFLPPSLKNLISIWTPGGTLTSRGGMFNVTVTPTEQVLVASREGKVVLGGPMIGAAYPGRALALDRPGAWSYAVPPSDAQSLGQRWLEVMTTDLMPDFERLTPERTKLLTRFAQDSSAVTRFTEEQITSLVVWAWQAKALLPNTTDLPDPDALKALWKQASFVRSQNQGQVWPYATSHSPPGLLGFTP